MKAIGGAVKTLFGLFFDDGQLAIWVLALIVWVDVLVKMEALPSPNIAMALLVGGTVMLLLYNVIRSSAAARRSERDQAPSRSEAI